MNTNYCDRLCELLDSYWLADYPSGPMGINHYKKQQFDKVTVVIFMKVLDDIDVNRMERLCAMPAVFITNCTR
jgi:hypothetical protein